MHGFLWRIKGEFNLLRYIRYFVISRFIITSFECIIKATINSFVTINLMVSIRKGMFGELGPPQLDTTLLDAQILFQLQWMLVKWKLQDRKTAFAVAQWLRHGAFEHSVVGSITCWQ